MWLVVQALDERVVDLASRSFLDSWSILLVWMFQSSRGNVQELGLREEARAGLWTAYREVLHVKLVRES